MNRKVLPILSASVAVALAVIAGVSLLPANPAQSIEHQSRLQKDLTVIANVLQEVHSQYVDEPNDSKLVAGAISGMLTALDPHSSYMDAKQFAEMQKDLSGEFGGVGLEVTMEDDAVKVVSTIEDTPAARAGLRADDIITKIDDQSIDKPNLDSSINRMRGPVGSTVKLTVSRAGSPDTFDVVLTRALVHVKPVKARAEGNVAYIAISNFSERTSRGVETAVADMKKKIGPSLKGYVIDLRNDPGGLLDEAISVSGEFLNSGRIVTVKGRGNKEVEHADATAGDITDGKPIVVLINGGTASAAEIVTGALQDDKRALVIGTRSFGKGSVQNIIPLDTGGALRLTTARYYTPSGRSIQARGIEPDIVVEQQIPAAMKEKMKQREKMLGAKGASEANLTNHLKNPDGIENSTTSPALAYVPTKPEDDAQLQYALNLLRTPSAQEAALVASRAPSKPIDVKQNTATGQRKNRS